MRSGIFTGTEITLGFVLILLGTEARGFNVDEKEYHNFFGKIVFGIGDLWRLERAGAGSHRPTYLSLIIFVLIISLIPQFSFSKFY